MMGLLVAYIGYCVCSVAATIVIVNLCYHEWRYWNELAKLRRQENERTAR